MSAIEKLIAAVGMAFLFCGLLVGIVKLVMNLAGG